MSYFDDYRIAIGWSGTASAGTPDPQPRCTGMTWGRRLLSGGGLEYVDGFPEQVWQWTYMYPAQLATFNTMAGLGEGTPSAKVTVRTSSRVTRDFNWYQAVILAPTYGEGEGEYGQRVYRDVNFKLIRLDRIS